MKALSSRQWSGKAPPPHARGGREKRRCRARGEAAEGGARLGFTSKSCFATRCLRPLRRRSQGARLPSGNTARGPAERRPSASAAVLEGPLFWEYLVEMTTRAPTPGGEARGAPPTPRSSTGLLWLVVAGPAQRRRGVVWRVSPGSRASRGQKKTRWLARF